jgi:hypothetical protein
LFLHNWAKKWHFSLYYIFAIENLEGYTVKLGYNDHGYNEFTAKTYKCNNTFLISNDYFTT